MKLMNIYRIGIGVLMLISGIVSILLIAENPIIGIILLCAGISLLITGITRHRRYGDEPESDERSRKISAYGITYVCMAYRPLLHVRAFLAGLFQYNQAQ
jgi:uncharacterized membrane protein